MFSSDAVGEALSIAGLLLFLISQVWLLVLSALDWGWWVLVGFLMWPCSMLYYSSQRPERCRLPTVCMGFAVGLMLLAFIRLGTEGFLPAPVGAGARGWQHRCP